MARVTFGSLEVGDTVFYLRNEHPYAVQISEGVVMAKGRVKDGVIRMKFKIDGKTIQCSPFVDDEHLFILSRNSGGGGVYIISNRKEFIEIARCVLVERDTLRDYNARSVELLLPYVSE